ncbi:LysR family transcriptional regulator, partial [Acinetobacter baumannii]|nr:LysR family transcriptional regulator [Acinetobacter baumannii]
MNMGIVVPTGHPLASRSAVRFSQCLDYPFILPSAPLMISEPVEALVNISGNEVKEVAVSNNIHMIRTLIKEQMGIGILCRLDILDEIESGQLAFVPLTDPQLKPFTL